MSKSPSSRRWLLPVAVAAAAAIAVPLAISSSHREAPGISLDPSADNTDVYAWTAPGAEDAITIASNWIPGQVPANGPNFFRFDDRARYYNNIDNNGDGVADIKYRFTFDTEVRNPNSFLYAGPGTQDFADPGLNVVQTYDLVREQYNRKGKLSGKRKLADDLPVAPPNIGPKTFPNYGNFVSQATKTLKNGTELFVGTRDEPFFVDLGATFDAINVRAGTGNEGQGRDDLSGYWTSSTIMQIPEREVTKNHQPVANADASNAVVGGHGKSKNASHGHDKWVQVSRLGNPLINEVIIPLGKKDKFNRTSPANDAKNFGKFALNPEPARLLNALFGLGVQETNRTDIVQALLTGVPGLTQIGKNPAAADTLKLNLGVAPAANPNRFGVLAGDVAGFPNGRRLADDAVDIELRVIAGALLSPPKNVPLGDGVDQNDAPFRAQFPYVAPAWDGFNSTLKRIEPQHAPVPQPPTP